MDNKRPLIAHLCLFCSGAFWGLMAPVGKDAMMHGIDGIDLVSFRVLGGAILFWLTSLFTKKEHVPVKDIFMFAAAGIFALVFNQCSYTIGLNMTSPSNSSIMTTSMPIFAMILSFFILKEPITWKKAVGVLMGCAGVYLGHIDNLAIHHRSCGSHRLRQCSDEHLVGIGLCHLLRHLHGLYLHDDWSEDLASYRGIRI